MQPINLAEERRRRRPFACATDKWLDDWIPLTSNQRLLVLLLQERARRKRCRAGQTSKSV